MKHIVLFSGGVASYVATKRVIEKYGKDDVILLFTDTKTEDYDLYRFLDDASKFLDIPIIRLTDGRTIWKVYQDVRYLGNDRIDPCSRILKRELSAKFVSQFKPDEMILYLGFFWDEIHRLEKARNRWLPYKVEAPLCDKPYLSKQNMFEIVKQDGIEIPRLYKYGLPHNNCGGGCVKAGIGHFAKLLDVLPEVFTEWEKNERDVINYLNKDVAILTRKVNGIKKPFPLSQLRKEREYLSSIELCDIGGCGCFDSDNDLFDQMFADFLE